MEKMKQLARTADYWPGIDDAIEAASRNCQSCAEHQNKPPKPSIHPWMLPEKPWSRTNQVLQCLQQQVYPILVTAQVFLSQVLLYT